MKPGQEDHDMSDAENQEHNQENEADLIKDYETFLENKKEMTSFVEEKQRE